MDNLEYANFELIQIIFKTIYLLKERDKYSLRHLNEFIFQLF